MATNPSNITAQTVGLFHYLDDTVEPSLFRNDKVKIKRDADGSDDGAVGVDLEQRSMNITNARTLDVSARRTVESNGMELIDNPLAGPDIDFFDHQAVLTRYYPSCVELVEAATGARAYAFDHNIRSASGKESQKRISGGQQVQGPAHVVHGDYTLTSAPDRLLQLAQPPSGNDTLRAILAEHETLITPAQASRGNSSDGRFAIINVWRNITDQPVATHPLALCDGQSVSPEELVVFEIHYADRVGENYFAKHSDQHRWFYYPDMVRDEAMLIKQWDSAGPLARSNGQLADSADSQAPCTFSFHSAFEDPNTPADAPDRWSIEVRCIVIYE